MTLHTGRSSKLDPETFYALLVLGEFYYRERALRGFQEWSLAMRRLGDRFGQYLVPVYGAVVGWPAEMGRPMPGLEGPPFLLRDKNDAGKLYVTDREGVVRHLGVGLPEEEKARLEWITKNAPEMLVLAINPRLVEDRKSLLQVVWEMFGPDAESELRERIRDPQKLDWLRRTVRDWVVQDTEARIRERVAPAAAPSVA